VHRIIKALAFFGTEDGGRKMNAAVLHLPSSSSFESASEFKRFERKDVVIGDFDWVVCR